MSPRSYTVAAEGKMYRRNRVHIKPRKTTTISSDEKTTASGTEDKDDRKEHHQDKEQEGEEPRRSTRVRKAPDVYQAGFN